MRYWQPGKRLKNGKYIVDKLLGSGGFGVTYKIIEQSSQSVFALKTLNHQIQKRKDFAQLQENFINEAIALASCRHPHIVRVYPQVFQEEGLWCMVMEYIEGNNIGVYLEEQGKFPEVEAIKIITKIGSALNCVHQQGFLHRDIKPSNILLREADSTPILIDFGSAREFAPGKFRNVTHTITECFAPLEQYESQGHFGAWTDIYALAATLYVLVTAELPIPAQFRLHAPLKPPQDHNQNLTDRTNQAIIKGMAMASENRPQTMAKWLELLCDNFEIQEEISLTRQQKNQHNNINKIPPTFVQENNKLPINTVQGIPSDSSPLQTEPSSNCYLIAMQKRWLRYADLTGVRASGLTLIDNILWSSGSVTKEYEFEFTTSNEQGENGKQPIKASYFTEQLGDKVTMDMVAISGGRFTKVPEDRKLAKLAEQNNWDLIQYNRQSRKMNIEPFYIGKFPITPAQWQAVTKLPKVERELEIKTFQTAQKLSVQEVSWVNAVEFCARLSVYTNREYRLPTETEWEYACSTSTNIPRYISKVSRDNSANYQNNQIYLPESAEKYQAKTTLLENCAPNTFGLHNCSTYFCELGLNKTQLFIGFRVVCIGQKIA